MKKPWEPGQRPGPRNSRLCVMEQKAGCESNCIQAGRQSPDLPPGIQDPGLRPGAGRRKRGRGKACCPTAEGVLGRLVPRNRPSSITQCGSGSQGGCALAPAHHRLPCPVWLEAGSSLPTAHRDLTNSQPDQRKQHRGQVASKAQLPGQLLLRKTSLKIVRSQKCPHSGRKLLRASLARDNRAGTEQALPSSGRAQRSWLCLPDSPWC